jgi:hypothetical protein
MSTAVCYNKQSRPYCVRVASKISHLSAQRIPDQVVRRRPPSTAATKGHNGQCSSPGAYKKPPLPFYQLSLQGPLQGKNIRNTQIKAPPFLIIQKQAKRFFSFLQSHRPTDLSSGHLACFIGRRDAVRSKLAFSSVCW